VRRADGVEGVRSGIAQRIGVLGQILVVIMVIATAPSAS
jgi:hypothetical protein